NHPLHLTQKHRPPRRLTVTLKPRPRQRQLLHCPQPTRANPPRCSLYHDHRRGFCRGSLIGTDACAAAAAATAAIAIARLSVLNIGVPPSVCRWRVCRRTRGILGTRFFAPMSRPPKNGFRCFAYRVQDRGLKKGPPFKMVSTCFETRPRAL